MPQFTEEEARRIFARAAEHQHAIDDAPPSLSLTELQDIGQAAGLSPESIAKAIAEVRSGPPDPEAAAFWGAPTTVQNTRVLPGPLTDEAWEDMVSQLRRTFQTQGIAASVGSTREWTATNKAGALSNLHVVATPTAEGARVTLSTSRAEEAKQLRQVGIGFPIGMVALFTLVGIADKGGAWTDPAYWVFMTVLASLLAVIPVIGRTVYGRWSSRRQREFDALLDQFELVIRTAEATPLARSTDAPEPLLGNALDGLTDTPDASSDATRPRTRA